MSLSSAVSALATRIGQEIKAVRAEVAAALAGKASTSHAATHASAGSDPVTPGAIGAATSGHSHGPATPAAHAASHAPGNSDPLTGYVPASAVGTASGVASLDSSGKVPAAQLPSGGSAVVIATDTSPAAGGTYTFAANTPTTGGPATTRRIATSVAGFILGNPTSGYDGQQVVLEITPSVAFSLTVTGPALTTGITSPIAVAAGKTLFLALRLKGSTWRVVAARSDT